MTGAALLGRYGLRPAQPSRARKQTPGGSDLLRRSDGKWVRFKSALTVTEGKALKNCPKRAIGVIESVSAVDANAGLTTRPGGPVYLMFMSRDSVDAPVVGPLDRMPTPAQLEALKGQRMCVLS
ncbi:MAG: hypothetical protein PGN26_02675 [Xylophilus ampelinus]